MVNFILLHSFKPINKSIRHLFNWINNYKQHFNQIEKFFGLILKNIFLFAQINQQPPF